MMVSCFQQLYQLYSLQIFFVIATRNVTCVLVCACVCVLTEISARYSEIKKMDILSAVKPAIA